MKIRILAILLLLSTAVSAAAEERFVAKLQLPTGQTVVVAEGDFEARSIGSFSVRLIKRLRQRMQPRSLLLGWLARAMVVLRASPWRISMAINNPKSLSRRARQALAVISRRTPLRLAKIRLCCRPQ